MINYPEFIVKYICSNCDVAGVQQADGMDWIIKCPECGLEELL